MSAERQLVFTSADARYMPGAIVALYSAMLCCSAKRFVVVTSAPQSEALSRDRLRLFEERGAQLLVVDSASIPLDTMAGATDRFPAEAFARFFADHLPYGEAERALYIDSDVMALGDLDTLLEQDLGSCCIAAAPDIHAIAKGKLAKQQQRIGLASDTVYLGSGVLLIDIARYRQSSVRADITSILAERAGQLIYPDQDALNLADRSQIQILGARYNFPPGLWRLLTEDERSQVAILHFYDGNKPWGEQAHRVPKDLLVRYDSYAEALGLSASIMGDRPSAIDAKSRAYAQKFWFENVLRRGEARRALSHWLAA